MALRGSRFQSAFARKHRAAGKAEGKAEDIVAILEERGITITAGARTRILACRDLEQLDRWRRLAVRVTTRDELLALRS